MIQVTPQMRILAAGDPTATQAAPAWRPLSVVS
jgi:hypothetical protein